MLASAHWQSDAKDKGTAMIIAPARKTTPFSSSQQTIVLMFSVFAEGRSRRNPQLPQPGHLIFLWPVTLHPVAVGARQLRVLDVVLTSASTRADVVHLQDAERELAGATLAPALLLAEEHVLVLAVRNRRVDGGVPGNGGACCSIASKEGA